MQLPHPPQLHPLQAPRLRPQLHPQRRRLHPQPLPMLHLQLPLPQPTLLHPLPAPRLHPLPTQLLQLHRQRQLLHPLQAPRLRPLRPQLHPRQDPQLRPPLISLCHLLVGHC